MGISTVALSRTDDDVDDCADDDADDDACLFMRSPITVYAAAVGGQMIQHRHRQPLQLMSDDR